MNTTQVVRFDATPHGVTLRLWIDDEHGRHVAVSELDLGEKTLLAYGRAVGEAQNRAEQQAFPEHYDR